MARLTPEEQDAREAKVRDLLAQGFLVAEIARQINMTRQSLWEFCARRKILPKEAQVGYSHNVADKDRRKAAKDRRKRADARAERARVAE
jgi:hypothetical protein